MTTVGSPDLAHGVNELQRHLWLPDPGIRRRAVPAKMQPV